MEIELYNKWKHKVRECDIFEQNFDHLLTYLHFKHCGVITRYDTSLPSPNYHNGKMQLFQNM